MSPSRDKSRRIHISRQEAVVNADGTRCCAWCGDFIDPIDWCTGCAGGTPCGTHKRVRKRSDAAFCNSECKGMHRSTFIRDCT